MKKLGTYLLYGGALALAVALIYISYGPDKKSESTVNTNAQGSNSAATQNQATVPAEKIQVFLFHATQRCSSCIAIGKFAKETVEQKFPEELKSGKIEFKEINIDLPENKELATKFKATGSALFINPIINEKDNIQEDTQVWRLVSNEPGFISYLENKLKGMIGSEASAQEK
ncbi:MAG: nitrophenyl compound nitroreductase subunit ArsF family protein [Parcubacteria group bacterium]|jgi:hypothetical protein